MSSQTLRGVFPMLVTPFGADGAVALHDVTRLVDHALAEGALGLAILGLGGESGSLEVAERKQLAETVLRHRPAKIPVIVGTTGQTRAVATELARHAAEHGAAALMVAPPSGGALGREGLLDYYAQVAEAAGATAVMVQDAPAYIGTSLGAAFAAELAARHANVGYLKAEGFPILDQVAEAVDALAGTSIGVFGGNGGVHTIDALAGGAVGMIPGCECVREHQAMFAAFAAGRPDEATAIYRRVMPLLTYQLQSLDFLIACNKELLRRRGIIANGRLRKGPALSDRSRAALHRYAEEALA